MPRHSLMIALAGAAIAVQPAGASSSITSQGQDRLLVGATVIDGTGADPITDGWIRLSGDRIEAVGRGSPPGAAGAEVMDLRGKTVIPGLTEMHAHLGRLANARWVVNVLLAHGVTVVRDAANSLGHIAAIRRWLGERDAVPHYYAANRPLQGSSGDMQFLEAGEDIDRKMEEYAAFGVDFVKVYNFLSTEGMTQVGDLGREYGLPIMGHTPLSGTSVAAIDAGLLTMEHLRLRPYEVLDDLELIAEYPIDEPLMKRTAFWAHLDPDGRNLAQTLNLWEERRDRFFVTPTLVTQEVVADMYDYPEPVSTFEEKPGIELVSDRALAEWKELGVPRDRWGDLSSEELSEAKRSVDGMATFTGLAHDRGIRILSGTDVGVPWLIPGVSLHRELRYFVERSGMTPAEAIRTSTGNAAEALDTPDRGTIEAGKVADLVIVDGNVAEDIGALANVEAVVLGGRILSRSRLLEEAERWAALDRPEEEDGGTP